MKIILISYILLLNAICCCSVFSDDQPPEIKFWDEQVEEWVSKPELLLRQQERQKKASEKIRELQEQAKQKELNELREKRKELWEKRKEEEMLREKQKPENIRKEAIKEALSTITNKILIVNNVAYDFTPVLVEFKVYQMKMQFYREDVNKWLNNERKWLNNERKRLTDNQENRVWTPPPNAPAIFQSEYIVRGKVHSVLPEGILFLTEDFEVMGDVFFRNNKRGLILVKDYEKESSVVDNDKIVAVGMFIGRYQYTSLSGDVKTLPNTIPIFYCAHKPLEIKNE